MTAAADRARECVILADFNAANLAALLKKDAIGPAVLPVVVPFGPIDALVSPDHWPANAAPDAALVWTRPEGAAPSFARALAYEPVAIADLLADVDRFCDAVIEVSRRVVTTLVPTWSVPASHRGWGTLDLVPGRGAAYALLRMNARLAERLSDQPGVFVLNADRWMASARATASAKLWYLAKVPFTTDVFDAAVPDIKAALRAVRGGSRKLLIVDLDDTLWGGVVGDVGWPQLQLGGHDAAGEAFQDVQRALQGLTRRGVLLAVVSKNEEAVALEAMRRHPEMVLRLEELAGWRINWRDKAENVLELAAELRLGLDTIVFLDNSPVERDRVRHALPDVLVPDWPADPLLCPGALSSLPWFDTAAATAEDALRAGSYAAGRERERQRGLAVSDDEWQRGLGATIDVAEFSPAELPRVVQLLNKTNQMNLSTRRVTEPGLLAWVSAPGHRLWTFRLRDRFGDYGLVGIVSVEVEATALRVVDFVLSCRAFGRQVEQAMLNTAAAAARSMGAVRVALQHVPTSRNVPCLRFLRSAGLAEETPFEFTWQAVRDRPDPPYAVVRHAGLSEILG